jgi:hypothetical protein
MKRTLLVQLAFFVVGSALSQSPAKIRITTWNLEWFPNGSPHDATPEKQAQRIEAAADVLKRLVNPTPIGSYVKVGSFFAVPILDANAAIP